MDSMARKNCTHPSIFSSFSSTRQQFSIMLPHHLALEPQSAYIQSFGVWNRFYLAFFWRTALFGVRCTMNKRSTVRQCFWLTTPTYPPTRTHARAHIHTHTCGRLVLGEGGGSLFKHLLRGVWRYLLGRALKDEVAGPAAGAGRLCEDCGYSGRAAAPPCQWQSPVAQLSCWLPGCCFCLLGTAVRQHARTTRGQRAHRTMLVGNMHTALCSWATCSPRYAHGQHAQCTMLMGNMHTQHMVGNV
eukprot:1155820-Pelagomonas_calceolata.AAC.4